MTNTITDYKSLQEERRRLEALLASQKEQIRTDFASIREQARPVTNLFQNIASVTSRPAMAPLLKLGVEMGIDVLLRRTMFKRAGGFNRLLMPMVMRVLSSNVLSGRANLWLKAIAEKFRKK